MDHLLASLLKQLVESQSSVPECLKDLYERHKVKQTRPLLNEIFEVLLSAAAIYSRVFIVVDALDEYQTSTNCRSTFLSRVFTLQTKTGANFFATSRSVPEVIAMFEESLLIEIRASEDDVCRYLDNHLTQLPSFVSRSVELRDEIKNNIVKAVDGMYVSFYVLYLRNALNLLGSYWHNFTLIP